MTVAVARVIGAILWKVIRVDNDDGSDCVGHFIHLRIRFDVTLPLLHRTLVTFPLTTHVCIKKSEATHGPLTPCLCAYLTSVFVDLEGTTNLWDKPIGSLACQSSTISSSSQGHGTSS